MSVLRDVQRSEAFSRVRGFEAAARFHVWHSQLGLPVHVDRKVQDALAAGAGFAVVGASGSGKTSTLAAAVLGADGFALGRLPIKLSVAGTDAAERAHDPRFLAGRVVRAVAQIADEAAGLVDAATSGGTATSGARTWVFQLGTTSSHLSRQITSRTESASFERTPDEVLDVAVSALEILCAAGLRPVLVLEDADGLLRLPNTSDQQRRALASGFFGNGLDPLLRALPVPAVVQR